MSITLPAPQPGFSRLPLDVLHLDSHNPRLPAGWEAADERRLLEYIANEYDAIEVARSIARYGYFDSEPLIAVRQDDGEYLVIEGNRRLTALRLLADPALASGLDDFEDWRELAEDVQLPDVIPAVIAESREHVAPIVGYRHISGIQPWEPYAKARFIARLVDKRMTFEEVSSIVGETSTSVAGHYRNQAIVKQASEELQIDTSRVTQRFGVFTRVMNSPALRAYIGAPTTMDVCPGTRPLSEGSRENVRELFSWLFGDDQNDAVLGESRQITDLGKVVESEEGLRVLKSTRNLEQAFIAAGGLRERLLRRLSRAYTFLDEAKEDMGAYGKDEEVQRILEQCRQALDRLTAFYAED